MNPNRVFILILLLIWPLLAAEKHRFDLPAHAALRRSPIGSDVLMRGSINDGVISAALLSGGYFTLGTTGGVSETAFDDHCALTYGHPYAMTSFPVLAVDGVWERLDQLLAGQDLDPVLQADTLTIQAVDTSFIGVTFNLFLDAGGTGVVFELAVENHDSISHNIGTGLFLDPALGKHGDGILFVDGSALASPASVPAPPVDTPMVLWEKDGTAKGISFLVSSDIGMPDVILADNWPGDLAVALPGDSTFTADLFYDLFLRMYWSEETLAPAQTRQFRMKFGLSAPDFSTPAFLRWDLPATVSIENNLLFPFLLDTYVELVNTGSLPQSDITIVMETSAGLVTKAATLSAILPASGSGFQHIPLEPQIVYEEQIATVVLIARGSDGSTLDHIVRNVYLPAAELFYTGLIFDNDSLDISASPELNFFFSVLNESTGSFIFNLIESNIFLFENGSRISEFTLGKYEGDFKSVDIVFVLDCSGSMGNDIEAVRANLGEFADSLLIRGYDFQIGVVTFSTEVDDIWDFTNDLDAIRANLSSIDLWGGVEDSPSALMAASRLSFRAGSMRSIIWITDEDYPTDNYTAAVVVDSLLALGITVHGVGLTSLQTEWFDPITLPTGGQFYDIDGNFRDILLDVARMPGGLNRYQLSYTTELTDPGSAEITVEVHYGNWGGSNTWILPSLGPVRRAQPALKLYPSPFNTVVTLAIHTPDIRNGDLLIYDLMGRRVHRRTLSPTDYQVLRWDASDNMGRPLGTGLYLMHVVYQDAKGITHKQTAKTIYLK
jgi:hypothetical protein